MTVFQSKKPFERIKEKFEDFLDNDTDSGDLFKELQFQSRLLREILAPQYFATDNRIHYVKTFLNITSGEIMVGKDGYIPTISVMSIPTWFPTTQWRNIFAKFTSTIRQNNLMQVGLNVFDTNRIFFPDPIVGIMGDGISFEGMNTGAIEVVTVIGAYYYDSYNR